MRRLDDREVGVRGLLGDRGAWEERILLFVAVVLEVTVVSFLAVVGSWG